MVSVSPVGRTAVGAVWNAGRMLVAKASATTDGLGSLNCRASMSACD
jgi:hypothetical protein